MAMKSCERWHRLLSRHRRRFLHRSDLRARHLNRLSSSSNLRRRQRLFGRRRAHRLRTHRGHHHRGLRRQLTFLRRLACRRRRCRRHRHRRRHHRGRLGLTRPSCFAPSTTATRRATHRATWQLLECWCTNLTTLKATSRGSRARLPAGALTYATGSRARSSIKSSHSSSTRAVSA